MESQERTMETGPGEAGPGEAGSGAAGSGQRAVYHRQRPTPINLRHRQGSTPINLRHRTPERPHRPARRQTGKAAHVAVLAAALWLALVGVTTNDVLASPLMGDDVAEPAVDTSRKEAPAHDDEGFHPIISDPVLVFLKQPERDWLPVSGRPRLLGNLLQPAGFERDHWQSFTAVVPELASLVEPAQPTRHVVVLDPGHGGSDPGTIGANGLLEKHLTLDIAQRVRLFLSEIPSIDVQLTRESDTGLSRDARLARVQDSDADLVLSLHLNNLPQTGLVLVETFYASVDNLTESHAENQAETLASNGAVTLTNEHVREVNASRRLANLLQQRVYQQVRLDNDSARNAGVKNDTLFVLTRSGVPGALIELTCLSNPAEAERLRTEDYRNALAAAIADSIREFLEPPARTVEPAMARAETLENSERARSADL